eukprot:403347122
MEGTSQINPIIKKKITIGGSSVTRLQNNNILIKRLTRHASQDLQLSQRRLVSQNIEINDENATPQRSVFSTNSQTDRFFNKNQMENKGFCLPDLKQRQKGSPFQNGPKATHSKIQSQVLGQESQSSQQSQAVTQLDKNNKANLNDFNQLSPASAFDKGSQSQRASNSRLSVNAGSYFAGGFNEELQSYTSSVSKESMTQGQFFKNRLSVNDSISQQLTNIDKISTANAASMLKLRIGLKPEPDTQRQSFNNFRLDPRISELKTYTPRSISTKMVKMDRQPLILMKEKSFAKLFDPTTFIQEDEPSYEDEVEGEEAKVLFYKKGSKLNRIIQSKKESPFTKYFQKCNFNHVIPQPMGIVNQRNYKRSSVQTAGYKMGDNYAQALGESLKRTTNHPIIVNLSINRLTDKGAVPILNSLSNDIQELDLSQNPLLKIQSYILINELLSQGLNKLQTLKLEKNNIGDYTCKQLCETLEGGSLLADALAINKGVQVLDASFNSFGSNQQFKQSYLMMLTPKNNPDVENNSNSESPEKGKKQVDWNQLAQSFKNMFLQNKCLIHLDLSHNGFMDEELETMSEGLKENHTILGLHMMGNEKTTDTFGYMTLKDNNPGASHIMTRITPNLEVGVVSETKQKLQCTSNCWVCEGWTQIMFQFNPFTTLHKNLDEYTPVYIHLSCDDYRPDLMERNDDGVYRLLRMVPPGSINYYFTIDSPEENQVYAHDQQHREVLMAEKVDNRFLKVPMTNIIENIAKKHPEIIPTFLEDLSIMIRPPPRQPLTRSKIKDPWDFNKSVFAQYQPDTEAIVYIGQLIFQEIINNTTVIHKELLTNSDVDLEYITTNAGVKQHKYNPDRALLFENELLPYFKNFDCHIWRKTHLWTESCDIVFKAYLPVIKMLYKQNSGRYTKPGHTPFMSLEEFQEMITCTNITSESFGTREIGIHFNLSKMTETNEVDFEKHMQMQFIEFIEALGRIAEKLNLETLRQKFGFQEEEEDREFIVSTDSKLSTKIEFLIKILMDANLNFAGNDKKFRQLNKQIENNIKQNKTTQQLNNQIVPEKTQSLMSIMISKFQQKQNSSRTLLGETPTPNTQSQYKFEFNSPHAQTFTAAMNQGNNIQKSTFANASNFAMKNQNNLNNQDKDYMQNAIDQINNDKPRSLGEILNVLKKAKQNQEKQSQQNYLNQQIKVSDLQDQ